MATSTIVLTYTAATADGTAEKGAKVTSMTVDGSAYAALTAAEVQEAYILMKDGCAALLRDHKFDGLGVRDRGVTS